MLTTWLAQWPLWATASCGVLLGVLFTLHIADNVMSRSPTTTSPSRTSAATCTSADAMSKSSLDTCATTTAAASATAFVRFRRQYLTVYCLVMFADWLQGTHMYSLYESYGVDVSVLFLTGFLSSALVGAFIGPIIDHYGRRNACLVYCGLEIAINLLESVPNMSLLLVGRVLGGISTSLLFAAFESWMVTEHRARGFADELLPTTFARASEANGALAVVAGVVAQAAADAFGAIGPFRVAVVVTAIAAAFVAQWTENYGDVAPPAPARASVESNQQQQQQSLPADAIALGWCYALFDGAMYVFVFLWYPTLAAAASAVVVNDKYNNHTVAFPSGLVFANFMLCIAIVSTAALLVPTITQSFAAILLAFFVFETAIGAFTPCCASLRSRYFPPHGLSTTLSQFRFPTNVVVVLGTGSATYVSRTTLFYGCSIVMALATMSGVRLLQLTRRATKATKCA